MLQGRDLIFVEERGTRFAKPFLFCPELKAHNTAVALGRHNYTDPSWIRACNAFTFPGVGHGALFAPPGMPAAACVTQIVADFLANPKQAPDSRCLAQVKPAFVVE